RKATPLHSGGHHTKETSGPTRMAARLAPERGFLRSTSTAHLKNEMRAKSTKEPSSRSPENTAKALARSPSWAGESEAVAFLRRVLVRLFELGVDHVTLGTGPVCWRCTGPGCIRRSTRGIELGRELMSLLLEPGRDILNLLIVLA